MVAEEDSARAREIAVEFDEQICGRLPDEDQEEDEEADEDETSEMTTAELHEYSRFGQSGEIYEGEAEEVDDWPRCPQCGKRRLTRCTFCGTAGIDFPPGDLNTEDILGLPTPPADASHSCSCGPGGCGTHLMDASETNDDPQANGENTPPEENSSSMLICPMCDEPFHPQYLNQCEDCGHKFSDGVEFELPDLEAADQLWSKLRFLFLILFYGIMAIGFLAAGGVSVEVGLLIALAIISLEVMRMIWKSKVSDDQKEGKK
jgi:hypothetical protein